MLGFACPRNFYEYTEYVGPSDRLSFAPSRHRGRRREDEGELTPTMNFHRWRRGRGRMDLAVKRLVISLLFVGCLCLFQLDIPLFSSFLRMEAGVLPPVLRGAAITSLTTTLKPFCRTTIVKLIPRDRVVLIVQDIYNSKCNTAVVTAGLFPKAPGCSFSDFGHALLREANREGSHLFTIQLGGMDGKSNDPMYSMFRPEKNLSNWLPAVFEPVKYNFDALTKTYEELATQNQLGCSLLAQQAISDQPNQTTCKFCYFNNEEDSPEKCKKHPDWMRLQIGTLQCNESSKYFNENFDCIVQDPLPCYTIDRSVHQWGLEFSDIAMLQIDVEGFELNIFKCMVELIARNSLPPVIHFEVKVLQERDRNTNTTTYEQLLQTLKGAGYTLFDDGEDALGLLLSNSTQTGVRPFLAS